MVEIILASKSKVRKEILDKNGILNRVEPSNVDEDFVKESLLKEKATPTKNNHNNNSNNNNNNNNNDKNNNNKHQMKNSSTQNSENSSNNTHLGAWSMRQPNRGHVTI